MILMFIMALVFVSLVLVGYVLMSSSTEAFETHSHSLATSTDSKLRGLFLFADTRRLVIIYVLALIGVPVLLLLFGQGVIIALIGFIIVLVTPRLVLRHLALRRRKHINEALPDALAQIAGAMRVGATFTSAMQSMVEEETGPLGQEFGLLLREQRLGSRLEEALDNLGERVQSEEMDLVISAALISQEVGGNLSEILQRLSVTIRRKLEMEGKVKALTSQGVLQGRVVTALPFLIMMALLVVEKEAMQPIFSSLLGWCFLGVMIVMQVIGSIMINKIVRIEI